MDNPKNIKLSDSSNSNLVFQPLAPVAIDIGGSFTKVVYWRPPHPPDLPSYIIKEFSDKEANLPIKPDPSLRIALTGPSLEGSLRFLKFPSSRTIEFVQFVFDTNLHEQYGPDKTKKINATGGGAYKYGNLVKEKLGVTLIQQDEMKCLIRGLNFILQNTDNDVFTYSWKDSTKNFISRDNELKADKNYPFPYLLVNIGSGVSILKVDDENTFERVSGSSIGGGTFWGLCRMLTNIKSFDDVKELSRKGDNRNVDLLVGDIYGCDYDALGLKAEVIASSFGKIATRKEEEDENDIYSDGNHSTSSTTTSTTTTTTTTTPTRQEDIVRSLLFMLSNNIAQIGYLNAKQYNMKRIFFSGGFLQDNEYVYSRFSYAVNFWSKGEMEAMFFKHNSYLGALGAFLTNN